MGWLMGCVLSPDKAKIFFNVCLLALRVQMRGVPLFGFGGAVPFDPDKLGSGPSVEQASAAWRAMKQLVFGDDWSGVAMAAEPFRVAWYHMATWAECVNAKIGVKLLMKTVVTGVCYDAAGRSFSPADPKLRLIGKYKDAAGNALLHVPFLPCDAFYKCIGVYRRADGVESDSWLHLKGKLEIAIRRVAKLRSGAVTAAEFNRCSDALLGGCIMHYCQSIYFSFEQFDKVEVVWRRAFARAFLRGRPCSSSSPLLTPPLEP
jgi:hypothetical protein